MNYVLLLRIMDFLAFMGKWAVAGIVFGMAAALAFEAIT